MRALNTLLATRRTRVDERGLALLDVLLGMAIFALIVVIGVQNFSTLRGRAQVTAVSSDVKQTGTAIESARIGDGTYAASMPSTPAGVNLSPGVSLSGYTVSSDGESFAVCAQHTSGAWAVFDSTKGSPTSTGGTGGCTSTSARAAMTAAVPTPATPTLVCPKIVAITYNSLYRKVTVEAQAAPVNYYEVTLIRPDGTTQVGSTSTTTAYLSGTTSSTLTVDKYVAVAVAPSGTRTTGCPTVAYSDVYP